MGGIVVGGTEVLVGATDVFVGTIRVDVGRKVGGAEVEVLVRPGSLVRRVAVTGTVEVGVSVRVTVGVAVAMAEVIVGKSDGVGVGAVAVGKGPRSAPAVSARAVLVLFAPCSEPAPLAGSRNVNQKNRIKPNRKASSPMDRWSNRVVVKFKFINFLSRRFQRFLSQLR